MAERIRRLVSASSVDLVERLQSLWGGYGELWRVELTRERGRPSTAIVKHVQPPPGRHSHSHRRKLRSYEVELSFYRQHATSCRASCRAPQALGLESQNGGWLFVLEDLDAAGFPERRLHASASDISATLRWLAAFHANFLGREPSGLWKVGTYWHLATRPDELAATRNAVLRDAAPHIDARLNAARFKTLLHGDAKLENVCFARDAAAVALVDFQYAGGGVGVKDVAYFLSSCLLSRECAALVPVYLDEYFRELHSALSTAGNSASSEAVEREWRELFPLAWVDFYRFVTGWAPGRYDEDAYSERLLLEVLSLLSGA